MSPRRMLVTLTAITTAVSLAMLAATFLAQASSLSTGSAWWTPLNVSDPVGAYTEVSPDIGVDANGTVHMVWAQGSSDSTRDPYYTYSTDGGLTWSAPDAQDTTYGSYDTTLVVSAGNTVHTAWCDTTGLVGELVEYLHYSQISGGHWGALEEVAHTGTHYNMAAPTIAVAGGYIHVLWTQGPQGADQDLHYSRRKVGGDQVGLWDLPTVVIDTPSDSMYASMAADDYGNLHTVWQEYNPTQGASDVVYYISGTVSAGATSWSTPISISKGVTEATTPDIVVGSDGTAHVVLGQWINDHEQHVWYAGFPVLDPNSATPVMIPGSQVGISTLPPKYTHPRIDLNGSSEIHIVWNGQMTEDTSDLIYHTISRDQGISWSTPARASADEGCPDRYPALAIGDRGIAHAAWQQKSGNDKDIYYAHSLSIMRWFSLTVKNYR